MKLAIARFLSSIASGDPNPVEWLLAWIILLYGVVLSVPFETFRTAAAYEILGKLTDETALGIGLGVVGIFSLWATGSGKLSMRRTATMIETIVYLFLAVAITLSVPFSLGSVLYVLAGYAAWAFLRLGLIKDG